MERLTTRDSQGRAYFDNDGTLIRGANGAFHQKKDMTAHYIHDRFVALDKVIDRLAAYEDIKLTPEEIIGLCAMDKRARMAELLRQEEYRPLTLEQLREMDGEPVWLTGVSSSFPNGNWDICDWSNMEIALFPYCLETPSLELCGKTWLAYRRKPEKSASC